MGVVVGEAVGLGRQEVGEGGGGKSCKIPISMFISSK